MCTTQNTILRVIHMKIRRDFHKLAAQIVAAQLAGHKPRIE